MTKTTSNTGLQDRRGRREGKERKGKERKGEEREVKEREGKGGKEKERKGKKGKRKRNCKKSIYDDDKSWCVERDSK